MSQPAPAVRRTTGRSNERSLDRSSGRTAPAHLGLVRSYGGRCPSRTWPGARTLDTCETSRARSVGLAAVEPLRLQQPYIDLKSEALELLAPLDGRVVGDVGCGDGRYIDAVRRAGARVVGVDLSIGMLAGVQSPPTLVAADAQSLPLTGASLDVVMMMHMLYRPGSGKSGRRSVESPSARRQAPCRDERPPTPGGDERPVASAPGSHRAAGAARASGLVNQRLRRRCATRQTALPRTVNEMAAVGRDRDRRRPVVRPRRARRPRRRSEHRDGSSASCPTRSRRRSAGTGSSQSRPRSRSSPRPRRDATRRVGSSGPPRSRTRPRARQVRRRARCRARAGRNRVVR